MWVNIVNCHIEMRYFCSKSSVILPRKTSGEKKNVSIRLVALKFFTGTKDYTETDSAR